MNDLQTYLDNFFISVSKRPKMYGGLTEIEATYRTLLDIEYASKHNFHEFSQVAYREIANKYSGSCLTMACVVLEQFNNENSIEAADELIKRLTEVRELQNKLVDEDKSL